MERRFVDLTGGYGVDTYFLSEQFEHTDYVEQNAELCRIAEHNFNLPTLFCSTDGHWQSDRAKLFTLHRGKEICVHHSSAEDFLSSLSGEVGRGYDLIFADPARRDSYGGKVFRLEDCTPNIVELLPTLLEHLTQNGRILLKLSPMLDITQAVNQLSAFSLQWSVYVVAVKNEVKEVLLLSHQPSEACHQTITCIDLVEPEKAFVFTREEEQECPAGIGDWLLVNGDAALNGEFLYEPNAAILKAGAYKLVAQRFGLQKLDVNTHLYASDQLIENFPGRVWRIKEPTQTLPEGKANVLTRNYPLTPEQLKKKLHIKDGGDAFIIGCRVDGKPTLFEAQKVEKK